LDSAFVRDVMKLLSSVGSVEDRFIVQVHIDQGGLDAPEVVGSKKRRNRLLFVSDFEVDSSLRASINTSRLNLALLKRV
jgi:hypothetical protein